MQKSPKILLWDIESSFNQVLTFGLRGDYDIPHDNIITERHIICISYKWLGEKKIHNISILDDPARFKKDIHDDLYVVREFRKVLEQADAQVFHYGSRFDEPLFAARMIFHNLKPLPKIINLDTKKIASKYFKFNCNRLDYLAKHLGYKGKMENPKDLWIKCFMGHVPSIKHMGKYCNQDIDILEFVYNRLSPFVKNNPLNHGMYSEGARCPNCGSTHLTSRGFNVTRTNKYRRFQCECGSWCDERKAFEAIRPSRK